MPTTATAGTLINSIRYQIPDRTVGDDPTLDGAAFTLSQLLIWINDASEIIAVAAPVIIDWWAVQTVTGQDLYQIPSYILDVRKSWYDLKPLAITSEGDDIFTTKVGGPSWWFGLHSTPADNNTWHIWPAPSRTGATTTLTAPVGASDASLPIANSTGFMTFGFLTIDNELIRYANLPNPVGAGNVTNILRGQGGTIAAAHNNGATVVENNVMMNVSRLPIRISSATDPVEIPKPLWPLIELYVISKVRATEQNDELAVQLRKEFTQLVEQLGNKAQLSKPRQGLQVRTLPMGRLLYSGRTYIP